MQFTLRTWKDTDLEDLVKYADNPKIAVYMMDKFINPYTMVQGRSFIEFAKSTAPIRIFAIDIEGHASGAIGIHPQADVFRKNAELGYWLAEPYWGKGIMTRAILQMTEYGFKTFDIDRIFARPYHTNIGSQRALEKAGFKLEGRLTDTIFKNGEYLDELIYSMRKVVFETK